jgi:hypothetical protein
MLSIIYDNILSPPPLSFIVGARSPIEVTGQPQQHQHFLYFFFFFFFKIEVLKYKNPKKL